MFAIELPISAELQVPPRASQGRRTLKIALVEDNPHVRQALACALTVAGHEVIEAGTGMELLARIGPHRPDVVLSDYRLAAGETGFHVISEVRAVFGDGLPAILLTGDTDPTLMRSMADRGIVLQYKPLDLDALRACLSALTEDRNPVARSQNISQV